MAIFCAVKVKTHSYWKLRIWLLSSVNYFFHNFFFLLTRRHIIFSLKNIYFLLKFCVKKFILQALFQSAQHLYEKREGSRSGAGSVPLANGSGSGRPKNIRIWIPKTAFLVNSICLLYCSLTLSPIGHVGGDLASKMLVFFSANRHNIKITVLGMLSVVQLNIVSHRKCASSTHYRT
jgi:hypothetical protein